MAASEETKPIMEEGGHVNYAAVIEKEDETEVIEKTEDISAATKEEGGEEVKKEEEGGEEVKIQEPENGPIKDRSCTDVLCLLLLLAFVLCWAGVGYWAISNGDPNTLVHPTNSYGQVRVRHLLPLCLWARREVYLRITQMIMFYCSKDPPQNVGGIDFR